MHNDWVRVTNPRPDAGHRLVCFPHAGGAASYFHPVARAMPAAVEVLAMQYPGRQDRRHEPPIDDIATLADAIVPELRDRLDRPAIFFGHSMGAIVAFEVARRLERDGGRLTALFASGRRAPGSHRDEHAHRGTDAELMRAVGELGGTEGELMRDPELVEMVLPAIRNDYRAIETYRYAPGPDVSCPIVAMIGDADPKVTPAEAQEWAQHTTGEFTHRVFPGGHFYLAEHLPAILDAITDFVPATAP